MPSPSFVVSTDLRRAGIGRRLGRAGVLLGAATCGFAAATDAQETGRMVGQVVNAQSGAPLGEVQVFLPSMSLGTLSRQNGRFVILSVPVGTHEVSAERIGLQAATQQVTVAAGEVAEVNFQMSTEVLGLDEIVVTGTAGAARRREIGNTINQINPSQMPTRSANAIELLQATAPGISVTRHGGTLGGGYNIRLRGNTTVSMSNLPIIYIDGVRMQSKPFPNGRARAAGTSGSGGVVEANPLNSINPADIERIEVIKGSAATTLYGTEASAGVIQVFTKRGSAGAPQWTLETAHDLSRSVTLYHGPEGFKQLFPYHRMGPFLSTGYLGRYAASVRGGGEALQYFMSGHFENGTGILPLDSINSLAVRANFTFTPATDLQVQWNSAYSRTWQRNTPQGGNANGLTHNAYRGQGNYFKSENPESIAQLFTQIAKQQIERFTTGGTVTYSPTANLTNRLSIGYDFSQQEVRNQRPFGFVFFPQGSIYNDTWENRLVTLDYVATYAFELTDAIRSSFSAGGQAIGETEDRVNAYGEGFPSSGAPTVSSAAITIGEENREKTWNAGFFFQNVFDISNKYFVTLGLRVDGNSSFGSDFGLQAYPKASASWVISDEDFWQDGWGSMKLRAAFGKSGRAPGAFDEARTWNAQPFGGTAGLVPGNLGNPLLGPEVTSEFEFGYDLEWFDGRLSSTFTYFNQRTTDALFEVDQIPSTGFVSDQALNIGELKNTGTEFTLDLSPIASPDFGWDVGASVTTNHSEVIDLGGIPEFTAARRAWIIEGEPAPVIAGRWLTNPEEIADPIKESFRVHGPAQPTLMVAPRTTLRLPRGIILTAVGEYRGGHKIVDSNFTRGGVSRQAWMPACWEWYVNPYNGVADRGYGTYGTVTELVPGTHDLSLRPETPALWRINCTPTTVHEEYSVINGDYFKLRNVSAQIPVGFAFPERVSDATLTLSLNNAWRWLNSDWIVGDPEQGVPVDGIVSGRPASRPPPTYQFHAALRVQF